MSVIGRRAEGVARHSRRRLARDAGIKTASKRKRAPRRPFRLLTNPTFL
ncbi:hypothetical protein X945_3110 [Burkholderia pseudomallei ABCPW 107]|nr:molybdopterin biosynthesis MoeB domain protein [Burkholderia pseudomallei]KGS44352.1 hypothetical protein X945_3110 [Burkholderia pseudomallei ABCPW 107]